jgi:hypothetical protein
LFINTVRVALTPPPVKIQKITGTGIGGQKRRKRRI